MTEQQSVIVRTWSATATREGAGRYRRYFAEALLPELREIDGFGGGCLLARDLDDQDGTVELTTHTFWRSAAAIQAFAGEDIGVSIVEPEARAFLLDIGANATHRALWVDDRT